MPKGKEFRIWVRILVKAFPQPSQTYQETVCCAGITEDSERLVRLFPIRYRRLEKERQFNRWDLVEMLVSPARDGRPESLHVSEESITIVQRATASNFTDAQRVALWKPFIYESLEELEQAQKSQGTSLGIIRPHDIAFEHLPFETVEQPDQDIIIQTSLLEEALQPLARPELSFRYTFRSGANCYKRKIFDWEVQAAYHKFKRLYGQKAMEKLYQQYTETIPSRNLHFVMGTMASRRKLFILIGLLRSGISPEEAAQQGRLL